MEACVLRGRVAQQAKGPECKALKRSVRGRERKAQKVIEGRPSGLREKVVREVRPMQCRRMCAEGHAQRPGFHEIHDCLGLMEAQGR